MKTPTLLLSALALLVSGVHASAAPLIMVADAGGPLYTVDAATGGVVSLGNTGPIIMADIAFDPGGQLYGISENKLYKISTVTAQTTLVGTMSISPWSLVFGSDGTLYAATSQLFKISTANAQPTLIGGGGYAYGSGPFPDFTGDLAFVGGQLYLTSPSIDFNAGFAYEDLVRLDTSTGQGTLVGRVGSRSIDSGTVTGTLTVWGLATPNNVDLYGVAGTQVISIDPTTGASTVLVNNYAVGPFAFLSGANGAAIATEAAVVPLPGTLALLATGIGFGALRARRRVASSRTA